MFSCYFSEYFPCFSLGKMSSDNSPSRVRERVEESVADRRLCMEKRQVLSERNLLRVDLRDPDDSGESVGVSLQLCLLGFSRTGARILRPYDCHLG
jgi:hypothetical protein